VLPDGFGFLSGVIHFSVQSSTTNALSTRRRVTRVEKAERDDAMDLK